MPSERKKEEADAAEARTTSTTADIAQQSEGPSVDGRLPGPARAAATAGAGPMS